MSDTPRALLFDVDGTLVDSNYLHTVTWWQAFRQAGHDVPMAAIHRSIGMGSSLLVDSLLPDDRDKDRDSAVKASHTALYATYWSRLQPLEGAADLLRACKSRGLRVVLASSADEAEFTHLLRALNADDVIDASTFSGDVEHAKPAPDLVQVALEKAEVPPSQALFVGDTVWDVQAAGKAGVPCVAVLSGGIGRDELKAAGAVAVYDGPADLLSHLDTALNTLNAR
ncbi:HAD family hydrolase [Actinocorallia libanotica]|uniref:HAD family hydrolase n=1 Tax=Actinocorallia libanotica TaxID=46162 RepID=A0ABN1RE48_9ACTN